MEIQGRHSQYNHDKDVTVDPTIAIEREPFFLEEVDFLRLIGFSNNTWNWFYSMLSAFLGIGIIFFSKIILLLIGKKEPKLETWEIVSIVISLCLTIILWLVAKFGDNKRTKLIEAIENHFTETKKRVKYRGNK